MDRVPSGVNMDGTEIHGLSMGKKSPPKIGRDLREGKPLQAFTSIMIKEGHEMGKSFKRLKLSHFSVIL